VEGHQVRVTHDRVHDSHTTVVHDAAAGEVRGLPVVGGVDTHVEPERSPPAVEAGQDYRVFVDYAHTEDALERVIEASRGFTQGRLITVFGCGGDRDRGKRPQMGSVATWGSDYVIVTTDNPRGEDPEQIFSDIRSGISRFNYLIIADRRKAIRHAVMMASAGDVVLIAGKGHEDYQEIRGERFQFSDREEALAAIEEKKRNDRGA